MSIVLEGTKNSFSALGGLALFDEMISASRLREMTKACLPHHRIKPQTSSFEKFKGMVLGFIAGADCLDDLDKLADDAGFVAVSKRVCGSQTYGRYLRSFDQPAVRRLNDRLVDFAFKVRKIVAKDSDFILDI